MIAIVTSPLPHKVGNAAIASGELKAVVMQFMENFLSLGGQLSTLQDAVRELQRRTALSASSASGAAKDVAMQYAINGFAICNVDLGADAYTKFYMPSLVPDATRLYVVEASFNNTSTTDYTCVLKDSDGNLNMATITSRAGATPYASAMLTISGDKSFTIDNQAAAVDVVVKIYPA